MRESPQAIEAYRDYLDMGTGRSLEALQRRYQGATDKTPPTRRLMTLKDWSRTFGWQGRVAQHEARIAAEAEERARKDRLAEMDKLRRVRLGIAQTEQAIALKWLQRVVQNDAAIADMKAGEIVALTKNAQDTQRLEYGEATDRHAVSLEEMSDADLLARAHALGLDRADSDS